MSIRDKGGEQEPEPVVIRDKRKIDRPAAEAGSEPSPQGNGDEPLSADAELLAERTADLQRLQAEYANYRKRADRERLAAGDLAVGRVLTELLPVLDDIDRARSHGDLTGGLKAIADQLETVFTKLGLVVFGEVGDPFDPVIHEAVMHNEVPDVDVPTCTTVMRRGYRHGERLLRPAMVGVSDPLHPAPSGPGGESTARGEGAADGDAPEDADDADDAAAASE